MMIPHPGFHRLKAFADEELTAARRGRIAAHLAHCTQCRNTVASIRELKAAVREVTASPVPEGAWAKVRARRAMGEQIILPASDVASPRRRAPFSVQAARTLRRAAVLVVGVAGVASATIPGSPVREWLSEIWQQSTEANADDAALPIAISPASTGVEPPTAGMSVQPVDGEVRITLESPDSAARIRIRISGSDQVMVRTRGGAAGALFRTGPGWIGIVGAGPGEIRIDLPRSTHRATLLVNGTPYLVKDGEQIRVLAPRADTVGAEFILGVRP